MNTTPQGAPEPKGKVYDLELCQFDGTGKPPAFRNPELLVAVPLSVLATSSLIITNKIILQQFPSTSASGFLTLLLVWSSTACSSVERPSFDWRWPFTLALFGTGSILCSNLILQFASVTFHQLSRVLMMPMSCGLEYAVHGRVVTTIDCMLFALLSGGVYLCLKGELTATPFGAFLALIANSSSVGGVFLMKQMCQRSTMSSKDFLEMMGPWEIGVSFVGLMFSGGATEVVHVVFSLETTLVLLLILNLAMAILVNCLSTYIQKTASVVLHSVLAQTKTAVTIFLGIIVSSGNPFSSYAAFGVIVCLSTSLVIALREIRD